MAEVNGETQLLADANEEQLLEKHKQEVKQLRGMYTANESPLYCVYCL